MFFIRSTTERCFRLSHFGKLVWLSVLIFCNFCCSISVIKMDPGNGPIRYGIVLVIKNFRQSANVKYLSHYPVFKTYHGRFIHRFSIMSKWWKIKKQKQNRVQTNKKRIQINLNRYLTHAQLNCSETGAHEQLFSSFLRLFSRYAEKKKQKQKQRKKKQEKKHQGLVFQWASFFFVLVKVFLFFTGSF